MPNKPPNLEPGVRRRSAGTIIASALLLTALALVVLYTSRTAFLSPLALVVIAAIGVAALLVQVRLRPDASSHNTKASRASLGLTVLGVGFAVGAILVDLLRLTPGFRLITALAAVVCFAVSGIALLNALRKRRF